MYDTLEEIKELLLAHIHGGIESKRINWKDINNRPATFGQVLFDAVVDAAGDGDYELLSAAINAGHKKIWIIDGQYDETTNDIGLTDGVVLIGQSKNGVLLNFTSGRLSCIGTVGNERQIRLENFKITNASGGIPGVIRLQFVDDSVLRNLKVYPAAAGGYGIHLSSADYNRFEKIDMNDCGAYGFYSDQGSWNTIEDCRIYNNVSVGLYLNAESYNTVKNSIIDNNLIGVQLHGNYSKILHNRIYGNSLDGIRGRGHSHSIIGNWIYNNSRYGIQLINGVGSAWITKSIVKNNDLRGNTLGALHSGKYLMNVVKNNIGVDVNQEEDTKYLKNLSGGNLLRGNIVAFENTVLGFTTTTALGDDKVYGILEENINNNSRGYVKVLGKVLNDVKVDGTDDIAAGDFLTTFTTAGIACKGNAGDLVIAISLGAYTNNDSLGTISAVLIPPRKL